MRRSDAPRPPGSDRAVSDRFCDVAGTGVVRERCRLHQYQWARPPIARPVEPMIARIAPAMTRMTPIVVRTGMPTSTPIRATMIPVMIMTEYVPPRRRDQTDALEIVVRPLHLVGCRP